MHSISNGWPSASNDKRIARLRVMMNFSWINVITSVRLTRSGLGLLLSLAVFSLISSAPSLAQEQDWSTISFNPSYHVIRGGPGIAYAEYYSLYSNPEYFTTSSSPNFVSVSGYGPAVDPNTHLYLEQGSGDASLDCGYEVGAVAAYGHCFDNVSAAASSAAPGSPTSCHRVGDPIVPLSGSQQEHVVDFTTGGTDPLTFERYFGRYGLGLWSSGDTSRLGHSWRSNFDASLLLENSNTEAYITLPDGHDYSFVQSGGAFVPSSLVSEHIVGSLYQRSIVANRLGRPETLAVVSGNYEFTDSSDTIWVFNSSSQIIEIRYRGGYVQDLTYDTNGFNTEVADNRSRSLTFTYSANGLLTSVTAPGSIVYQYTYQPKMDPSVSTTVDLSIVDPPSARQLAVLTTVVEPGTSAPTTTYSYEDTNNSYALTGITDERGVRYATFGYDSNGNAISTEMAGGVNSYTVSYDIPAGTVTTTNPYGKQTVYTFTDDSQDNRLLTKIEGEPSANCPLSDSTFSYDSNNYLSDQIDAEGRDTHYINNSRGLPTSITRGYGSGSATTTDVTWSSSFRLPTEAEDPGLTTDGTYDSYGRLTALTQTDTTTTSSPYSTNGQTRTWVFTYGTGNLLLSVDGPLSGTGDTTTYTYDSSGYLASVTDPLGHLTTVNSVNDRGQPTSVTDPNGIETGLSYDDQGRLTSVSVDKAGTPSTTAITYDAAGDVTKITQPSGAYEAYTYDDARQLTTVTNNTGETVNYVRDGMGNATSINVERADTSTAYGKSQVFDELGRLIQSIGASSQTYHFGYDKTDNLTSIKDPRSNTFSYGFDALNRLIQETDEESNAVSLTRDGTDQITTYTDPRSLATAYVRNGFGEIIEEHSPDKGTTVYVRDARGLVTQRTDPRSIVTNYTYDADGRLLTQDYVGSSADNVTYGWDETATGSYPVGHLTSIIDDSGSTAWRYDSKGRIFDELRTIDTASANETQYTYDASGNVATITYPSGRIVTYTRDSNGHVSSITTQASAVGSPVTIASSTIWQPWGPIGSLALGNGLTESFGTDTDYRVSGVTVAPSSGSHVVDRSLSWTGETLDSITNNLTSANSESFTYTPTRRLSGATGAYGTLGWTYDAVGNRASQTDSFGTETYTYPSGSNQLSSIVNGATTVRSFGYNAAGDINSDANASFTWTYGYDEEDRLSSATAGTTSKGSYTYDALWRLAKRVVTNTTPSGETHFIHDLRDHIIAETDSTGATTREYIWLDDLPVAVIDNAGSSPTLYFVHTDHLYRPVAMTDGTGLVVWSALYKPFGDVQSITGTPVLDMRFPGQWFQLETGLHYNWHRHYDSTLGRYIQPDPLEIDEDEAPTIAGIAQTSSEVATPPALPSLVNARQTPWIMSLRAQAMQPEDLGVDLASLRSRSVFPSGPNIYGYVSQSPTSFVDLYGLQEIKGFSGHALGRMQERGISPGAVIDACQNPLRVIPQANGNTMYCGSSCTVILSPNGWVVTIF